MSTPKKIKVAKEITEINKQEEEGNLETNEGARLLDSNRKKVNFSTGERRSMRLRNKKR